MNKARRKQIDSIDTSAIRAAADTLKGLLEAAHEVYEAVRDEEQEAFDNLPESLQEAERGEQMNNIIDGLDTLLDALDTGIEGLSETADAIDAFENDIDLG